MSRNRGLLAYLGERLDVQLPVRTHQGRPTAEYRGTFAGYQWIKGESLMRARVGEEDRGPIARSLATLLRTLHPLGAITAKRFSVATTDRQNELSLRAEIAQKRASELATSIYADISAEAAAEMTPAPDRCPTSDYRLVHGDLHPGQILVDGEQNMVAVIDWDDVRLGDPAYDLQMVYSFVPPSSRSHFWDRYGPFAGHHRARHLALSYGLAFLARAMRDGDSELAHTAASQLRNALG